MGRFSRLAAPAFSSPHVKKAALGHYRVRLNGEWIVVPDNAVVTEPNKFGPAVVWPYMGTAFTRPASPSGEENNSKF